MLWYHIMGRDKTNSLDQMSKKIHWHFKVLLCIEFFLTILDIQNLVKV